MMYCFGNSHAHFFTDSSPGTFGEGEKKHEHFRSFSLGPVIAYNFIAHHFPTMIQMVNKLPLKPEDPLLIAIGEVDCRWHLPKQAESQKGNVKDIVHECIDRLFQAHLHLQECGYRVVGWGGHPSTNDGHNDDLNCPVYGDVQKRNEISLEWSDYLEKRCKEAKIEFVSIIRDLINVDKTTKMEYYKDYCHLDPAKYLPVVVEKFKIQKLI